MGIFTYLKETALELFAGLGEAIDRYDNIRSQEEHSLRAEEIEDLAIWLVASSTPDQDNFTFNFRIFTAPSIETVIAKYPHKQGEITAETYAEALTLGAFKAREPHNEAILTGSINRQPVVADAFSTPSQVLEPLSTENGKPNLPELLTELHLTRSLRASEFCEARQLREIATTTTRDFNAQAISFSEVLYYTPAVRTVEQIAEDLGVQYITPLSLAETIAYNLAHHTHTRIKSVAETHSGRNVTITLQAPAGELITDGTKLLTMVSDIKTATGLETEINFSGRKDRLKITLPSDRKFLDEYGKAVGSYMHNTESRDGIGERHHRSSRALAK